MTRGHGVDGLNDGVRVHNLLASYAHLRTAAGGHWAPRFVEGDEPMAMHRAMAAALEDCLAAIRAIQTRARASGEPDRPRWPMIVLKAPKGWTGPKVVDGHRVEGTWRAHQVPLAGVRDNPEHLAQLEAWLERDPITLQARRLEESGVDVARIDHVRELASEAVATALEQARAMPDPDPADRFDHVWAG